MEAEARRGHRRQVVGDTGGHDAHIGLGPQALSPHGLPHAHRVDVAAAHVGPRARVSLDAPQPLEPLVHRVVARLADVVLAAEGGPEGAAAEQQLVDSFDANFGALVAMRRDGAPFEPAVAEACYAAMAYLPDAALSELTTQLTLVSVQLVADGERKGWHREAVPAA